MSVQLVRPPTLAAAVVDSIREAILRGYLRLGAPLREIGLGKTLDISLGTVREALRKLEEEGLVEVYPHRGAFVTRLPRKKVREIYTLRAQLEPFAVRLAMEDHAYTQSDMALFETLLERIGELERQGKVFEMVRADAEFHLAIAEKSGHDLLLEVLRNLQSKTMLVMAKVETVRSDREAEFELHRVVLDAIRSNDPQKAEEVLKKHIIESGDRLVKHMEAEPAADEQ